MRRISRKTEPKEHWVDPNVAEMQFDSKPEMVASNYSFRARSSSLFINSSSTSCQTSWSFPCIICNSVISRKYYSFSFTNSPTPYCTAFINVLMCCNFGWRSDQDFNWCGQMFQCVLALVCLVKVGPFKMTGLHRFGTASSINIGAAILPLRIPPSIWLHYEHLNLSSSISSVLVASFSIPV